MISDLKCRVCGVNGIHFSGKTLGEIQRNGQPYSRVSQTAVEQMELQFEEDILHIIMFWAGGKQINEVLSMNPNQKSEGTCSILQVSSCHQETFHMGNSIQHNSRVIATGIYLRMLSDFSYDSLRMCSDSLKHQRGTTW